VPEGHSFCYSYELFLHKAHIVLDYVGFFWVPESCPSSDDFFCGNSKLEKI